MGSTAEHLQVANALNAPSRPIANDVSTAFGSIKIGISSAYYHRQRGGRCISNKWITADTAIDYSKPLCGSATPAESGRRLSQWSVNAATFLCQIRSSAESVAKSVRLSAS